MKTFFVHFAIKVFFFKNWTEFQKFFTRCLESKFGLVEGAAKVVSVIGEKKFIWINMLTFTVLVSFTRLLNGLFLWLIKENELWGNWLLFDWVAGRETKKIKNWLQQVSNLECFFFSSERNIKSCLVWVFLDLRLVSLI